MAAAAAGAATVAAVAAAFSGLLKVPASLCKLGRDGGEVERDPIGSSADVPLIASSVPAVSERL